MKHAYLITNSAYKVLNQASFLRIMHRYDRTNNIKTKTPILSNIDI